MSDIEVVIKIDEDTYKRIQALARDDYFEHDICGNSMRRIANGTPLPKGHGRLIDRDRLREDMIKEYTYRAATSFISFEDLLICVWLAPTVIKEDYEE